uniref:THAP-type domain-containing protein n=1 Tax=Photinus pyralis TaxID=7054 RepID=A0A1Y1K4K4_PHOPY
MGGCAAEGCSNSAKKGFLMKRFPRDPKRKQEWMEWIIKMKKGNWQPTDAMRLCEVHFGPEMWEKTRVDGKRVLKCNAVPTMFAFSKSTLTRKAPTPENTSVQELSKFILNCLKIITVPIPFSLTISVNKHQNWLYKLLF